MTEKRITKKDNYNELISLATAAGRDDLVEFCNKQIELLSRKNGTDKKPSAKQVENDALRQEILAVMEPGKQYTLSELAEAIPALNGAAPQKMSGLVKPLVGVTVAKTIDKRKTYFSLM